MSLINLATLSCVIKFEVVLDKEVKNPQLVRREINIMESGAVLSD